MLSALARYGHPTGLDLHPLALALAQVHLTSPYPLLQASILHLPLASGSLDLITTFDVLYHRAVIDDGLALAEFFRVLKPDGWLLIRVPALESLRGAHDRIVHTRQRYTQAELAIKLRQAGFRVQRLTYANTLLFPLIYLRRILAGRRPDPASDVELPTPILNRILEFILKVENQWLKHLDLPIGVSLFALAQKP
jgi:SAM-dependent methyltransferase